jgi:hypothetical protein
MKSKILRRILIQVVLLLISLGWLLILLSLFLMTREDYAIPIWVAFVADYSIFFVLFIDTLYLVWNRHEQENEGVKNE